MKAPDVIIQVGKRGFPALAERLSHDDGEEVFIDYQKRHPNALKNLSKLIGYEIGDGEGDIQAFIQRIPIIRFMPKI